MGGDITTGVGIDTTGGGSRYRFAILPLIALFTVAVATHPASFLRTGARLFHCGCMEMDGAGRRT